MTKLSPSVLLLSLLVVAGCSSQVTRPDNADIVRPDVTALQDFTIQMSQKAKLQLADNVTFDIDALRSTLSRTLDGKGLTAADGDYRLKVVVNDIRVRPKTTDFLPCRLALYRRTGKLHLLAVLGSTE